MNTNNNYITSIIEIMKQDMVYIPKAVMKREDVYEESKMMFSIIFTDCLKSIAENGRTATTVNQMMKVRLNELSIPEICFECFCSRSKAGVVRKETLHLINNVSLADCIREVR